MQGGDEQAHGTLVPSLASDHFKDSITSGDQGHADLAPVATAEAMVGNQHSSRRRVVCYSWYNVTPQESLWCQGQQ